MEKLKRKEKEYLARRAVILEEAEKIFAQKGFYNTSVAEIANASGFATGSIYQYFEGKEDLYATMINRKLDQLTADLERAVESRNGLIGKLEVFILTHFQFVEKNLDFWRLFVRRENVAFREGDTTLNERMIGYYLKDIEYISEIIGKGLGNGGHEFPASSRDMGCALMGIMNAYKFTWILDPEAWQLTEKVPVVLDIFLKGVGDEI